MYLFINAYTNSNNETIINNVIQCDDFDSAYYYMQEYANEAWREREEEGSLEDVKTTDRSITLKGEYYIDHFEVYRM